MQSIDFNRLKIRLLRGGIAPKFVRRTIQELQQHLEELIAQEKSAGISETEARAIAFGKLGDEDKLVSEALARKEIRSWSSRYSKSFFSIFPFATYLLFMIGFVYFGIGAISDRAGIEVNGEMQSFYITLARVILFFVEYLITPMIAAAFAILAVKRNIPMLWPIVGIVILSFFGSGFETTVHETVPGSREGGITLFWGWSFLPWRWVQPEWTQTTEQLVRVAFTLAMVVFCFKRYRPYEQGDNR